MQAIPKLYTLNLYLQVQQPERVRTFLLEPKHDSTVQASYIFL